MMRFCRKLSWLLAAFTAVVGCAFAAQPLKVPADVPVYSAPVATIEGRGAVPFHITFGVLVVGYVIGSPIPDSVETCGPPGAVCHEGFECPAQ